MTTKDTALRLALEALENFARFQRMMLDGPDTSDKLLAEDYAEAAFMQGARAIPACREALAQPAGERGELIRKAMRKAYSLGQTYWQQADSEFTSHHKKADATHTKFITLVEETAALLSSDAQPSEWVGLTEDEVTTCHSEAVLSKKHDGTDPSFTTLLHRQIEAKLKEKNHGK